MKRDDEDIFLLMVAAKYDPLEILDLLDMETEELVEVLADKILECSELFEEAVEYVRGK